MYFFARSIIAWFIFQHGCTSFMHGVVLVKNSNILPLGKDVQPCEKNIYYLKYISSMHHAEIDIVRIIYSNNADILFPDGNISIFLKIITPWIKDVQPCKDILFK